MDINLILNISLGIILAWVVLSFVKSLTHAAIDWLAKKVG